MMKRFLIPLALFLISGGLMAQMSGQIGAFDLLPQRVYANPALMPQSKINVAIPALGNIYFESDNNWIRPRSYVAEDVSGSNVLSAESILANIDDAAVTGFSAGVELFFAGFRFGNSHVHLRASERVQMRMSLPGDIFRLAVYGNTGDYDFEANTANFSGLSLDAIHFREYAVGFGTEINYKLNFGAVFKYLYGMEVIQTTESSLRLRTDPDTYVLSSSGSYAVNTSGIYSLVSDEGDDVSAQAYLFGKDNTGFGFDLGATYRPIEKLELQVSAHDIGFIRWRQDIANYRSEDATFLFDGVDLTEFLFQEDADFSEEFENEADSLLNELEEVYSFERTEEEFSTGLNGYLRYGAAYTFFESEQHAGKGWVNVVHGLGESMIPFQASMGYNQRLWNAIQAGLHISKRADLPLTLGGGLSLNAGPFQIYALVENLKVARVSKVTVIDQEDPNNTTELFLPAAPMDLRLHVGVNLTFNRSFGAKSGSERAMLR